MEPINSYNYLRPNSFRMSIQQAPSVSFTCQTAEIPGINSVPADQATPFISIPHAYDKIQYPPFGIEFIISESLDNYLEIFNWMRAIGFPEEYKDFLNMPGIQNENISRKNSQDFLMSDISLIALDSDNHTLMEVTYLDAFPVALGSIIFNTKVGEYNYLTASTNFAFRDLNININRN